MRSQIILCLLSLWVVEGHGALPIRLSPTVIGQEGENVCPSQVAVNAQLNVTKEEVKQVIITILLNPAEVVDGPE